VRITIHYRLRIAYLVITSANSHNPDTLAFASHLLSPTAREQGSEPTINFGRISSIDDLTMLSRFIPVKGLFGSWLTPDGEALGIRLWAVTSVPSAVPLAEELREILPCCHYNIKTLLDTIIS
jgi:hypothetical protein